MCHPYITEQYNRHRNGWRRSGGARWSSEKWQKKELRFKLGLYKEKKKTLEKDTWIMDAMDNNEKKIRK